MNFEDVCREAGVDPCECKGDMRRVITFMEERYQELKQEYHRLRQKVQHGCTDYTCPQCDKD